MILGKGFIKSNDFENTDIIFYSEGKQYWSVFLPVIKALEKKNTRCAYLTSDKDDPGLEYQSEHYDSKFIGNLTMTSVYLPPGFSYEELHDLLKERGFVIYNSQSVLRGKVFMLGVVGLINEQDIGNFLEALGEVIEVKR